jgi:acetyltransferase-like isoleucine patch superfamily enzyme
MIRRILKYIYTVLQNTDSLYYCLLSGIKYNTTFRIKGKIILHKNTLLQKGGELILGKYFKANSTLSSNSLGVSQPVIFNISTPGSKIVIGNNVGISGSTINAMQKITIGDNVMIGSGCLISDNDSHSLDYRYRDVASKVKAKPINICSNVFIGARSIILKGVTIGEGAVIGAGSVVTHDVPSYTIYAGNPARFVKKLELE